MSPRTMASHDLATFIRSETGKAALNKYGFSTGD
jgi:hypothetical protein